MNETQAVALFLIFLSNICILIGVVKISWMQDDTKEEIKKIKDKLEKL